MEEVVSDGSLSDDGGDEVVEQDMDMVGVFIRDLSKGVVHTYDGSISMSTRGDAFACVRARARARARACACVVPVHTYFFFCLCLLRTCEPALSKTAEDGDGNVGKTIRRNSIRQKISVLE